LADSARAKRGWTLKSPTGRYRRIDLNEHGQESQNFLLSKAACTLSPFEIAGMSDAKAYKTFKAIRFHENGGEPFCPRCGVTEVYTMKAKGREHPLYKCAECRKPFTVTTCTALAGRKMPIKKILYAIAMFTNGVSGVAALRLRREIKCSYKAAFVLSHKLREALGNSREKRLLTGIVEVDGTVLTPKPRKANMVADRKNFGVIDEYTDAVGVKAVVIARERGSGGESRAVVVDVHEARGSSAILKLIDPNAMIYTDEGNWSGFARNPEYHKVKHKEGLVIEGRHINLVESVNARLKRAAHGVHYRIRDKNLDLYVNEILWREDYRRLDNGQQWSRIVRAVTHQPISKRFKGYWQRHLQVGTARRRRRSWNGITQVSDVLRASESSAGA
jgi:transposase-like protein